MTIENVGAWGQYDLYKASWRGTVVYGTTHLQAFSNMLGYIESLKWENYKDNLK